MWFVIKTYFSAIVCRLSNDVLEIKFETKIVKKTSLPQIAKLLKQKESSVIKNTDIFFPDHKFSDFYD